MRATEFTQLNELNKDTLHSYHAKADMDIERKHRVLGPQIQGGDAPAANKTAHKIGKRMHGLDRASDRLNKDMAEGHDGEELANQVYTEFERIYPNLARKANERTVHAAIMDVLNYGGDNNPSALAQDVARAVKHDMQHGMAEEQFCEECGGSLAEAGKASRALCKSSRSNADLGVSQLASCKSQGLRARESSKKHEIGGKRASIKGKTIKGHKYGGPLPYNKSDN